MRRRSVSEESIGVALRGRGVPENVTSGPRRAARAGPIPLTRRRFASEPKAPCLSRSAMIRRASTGPTPGSASSSSADATSTSIFVARNATLVLPLGSRCSATVSRPDKLSGGSRWRPRGFAPFARPFCTRRAESTAASWPSSACMFDSGTWSIVPTARNARTEAPRSATLARKRRAFFSAGVGMPQFYAGRAAQYHRIRARRGESELSFEPRVERPVHLSAVRCERRVLRAQLLSFPMRRACISPDVASPGARGQRRATRRESLFLVAGEELLPIAVRHLANLDRFRLAAAHPSAIVSRTLSA